MWSQSAFGTSVNLNKKKKYRAAEKKKKQNGERAARHVFPFGRTSLCRVLCLRGILNSLAGIYIQAPMYVIRLGKHRSVFSPITLTEYQKWKLFLKAESFYSVRHASPRRPTVYETK